MDIAVCVAPEKAFDPGLRAHVSGVWANQKYKIETPNCLVIFKRQIRKTLLTGWGTDVFPPTSPLSGAGRQCGSPSHGCLRAEMVGVWGICLRALWILSGENPPAPFHLWFFWDRSPSAARQALAPGASPENQVHLGSKSTPCEAGGVGSRMFPGPGTMQRLMEPPEGCYKRAGSRAYSPLGTAVVGAGGGWGEDVCGQPLQGGEHPI